MWLEFLPDFIASNASTFGLLIIGYLVEKKYVSRPATFANVLALNTHAYQQQFPAEWLIWYANIGLLIGVVAISSYAVEEPLPGSFYDISYWIYSSLPVAGVIIWTLVY